MTEAEDVDALFPRLSELMREGSRTSPSGESYFSRFPEIVRDIPAAREQYVALDQRLQRLDASAWGALKRKSLPRVCCRHSLRAWQPLFAILNESYGYELLLEMGFRSPRFLPDGQGRTPDLMAQGGGGVAAVEVKTFNESDDELRYLHEQTRRLEDRQVLAMREVPDDLPSGFTNKLERTLVLAHEQLSSPIIPPEAQRIVLLVVRFDHDMHTAPMFDALLVQRCVRLAPFGIDVVVERGYTRFGIVPAWRLADDARR
jgi:hypothetical protein